MGTRSLTRVLDERGRHLVTCYKQYDGYPDGYGKELAEFIKSGKYVNGFGGSDQMLFNGMDCFAAMLVWKFKQGETGGFYIMPRGTKDVGEEYVYTISYTKEKGILMSCQDVYGNEAWVGYTPDEFLARLERRGD